MNFFAMPPVATELRDTQPMVLYLKSRRKNYQVHFFKSRVELYLKKPTSAELLWRGSFAEFLERLQD